MIYILNNENFVLNSFYHHYVYSTFLFISHMYHLNVIPNQNRDKHFNTNLHLYNIINVTIIITIVNLFMRAPINYWMDWITGENI